jgi:NADH pyrophosphatase NudC (nudix superfamily)
MAIEYKNPTPVAVMCYRLKGEVLLIERSDRPGTYSLPAGYVEENENFEKAACRELEEETGIFVSVSECRLVCSETNKINNMLGFVVAEVECMEGKILPNKKEVLSTIFVSRDKYDSIKDLICFPLHRIFLDKLFN